jgi:hypothetical protein
LDVFFNIPAAANSHIPSRVPSGGRDIVALTSVLSLMERKKELTGIERGVPCS